MALFDLRAGPAGPSAMDAETSLGSQSIEEELAVTAAALLSDDLTAKEAVEQVETMCHRRAKDLRTEAQQLLHRPARRLHLLAMADELESNAATWHLVWCLFCNESGPGGVGGPVVQDAGGCKTYRQQVADVISADALLTRCASVVSWLESLADDALKRQQVSNRQSMFAPGEGVWRETMLRLGLGGQQLVSELDPDAPTREDKSLFADNSRAEERLMLRLWQLIRAGLLKEARELCQQVGQPWRASSLGGCGAWGPLPVGVAASMQDDGMSEVEAAEELAGETEGGAGLARALWKWTCFQLAQQATAGGAGVSAYEAAVYGAMCGHVRAVLPVCSSWEDGCWALCRAWLELRCDELVGLQSKAQELVGSELVTSALLRCGVNAGASQAAVEGCAAVVSGSWTAGRVTAGVPGLLRPPANFDELFAALDNSPNPKVSEASQARLRQVQRHLIQGSMHALTQQLYDWLVMRAGAATDSDSTSANARHASQAASAGNELALVVSESASGDAPGGAGAPKQLARATAFAAHLLLLLEALGKLHGDSSLSSRSGEADLLEASRISATSQQLVVLYVAKLLERGSLLLVPQYLCHLRESFRSVLCHELLTQLSAPFATSVITHDGVSEAVAHCYSVYNILADWFTTCYNRQLQPPSPLRSHLITDIRPDELRLQLRAFNEHSRFSPAYGPAARVQLARWLTFPCLAHISDWHTQQQQEEAPPAPSPEVHASYLDALELLNALCCELALGDEVSAAAAHMLFDSVIPEGLEEAVHDAAAGLQTIAQEASAQDKPDAAADAANASQQLQALLSELRQWRTYYSLDARVRAWQLQHESLGRGGGLGEDSVLHDGTALLLDMTDQLVASGWLSDVTALSRLGNGWEDARSASLVLTAYPTVSDPQPGAGAGLSTAGQPLSGSQYPLLKGAELFSTLGNLQSAVAAAAQTPTMTGIQASVIGPEGAEGVLTVSLTCDPSIQAWQSLVAFLVALVHNRVKGQPPLMVVNLRAARPTSAEICRRACLEQTILRCCSLRHALVCMGGELAVGSDLVELLAAPSKPGSGGLGHVLSPTLLQKVLLLEADTQVAELQRQ